MACSVAFNNEARTILITEQDLSRLKHLVDSARLFYHDRPYIESLDQDLDEAQVVNPGQLPNDIVTMNSEVRVTDLAAKKQITYTLVFPKDANYAENRISVLAPIGAALLGASAGEVVALTVPGGRRRLRVDHIIPAGSGMARVV